MSSTSAQRPLTHHPSMRRISQVFVEIPPSPISRAQKLVQNSPHVPISSINLKENARLQPSKLVSHADTTPTTPSSLKRKSSIAEVVTSAKKQKVMTAIALNSSTKTQSKPKSVKIVPENSSTGDSRDELRKTTFHCHHCNRRQENGSEYPFIY
jgi:hypothetical protein